MSDKLRKSYRLDVQVVDRLQLLQKVLTETNGIRFTETDVITYLTNWYYNNMLTSEEKGEE